MKTIQVDGKYVNILVNRLISTTDFGDEMDINFQKLVHRTHLQLLITRVQTEKRLNVPLVKIQVTLNEI